MCQRPKGTAFLGKAVHLPSVQINTTFMRKFLFLFLGLSLSFSLQAQLRYGFKTGLNFCQIQGESEVDDAGTALESWKNNTGFHIGMGVSYPFTDKFSLRAEFMYSKRGGKYTYNGASYRIFTASNGNRTFTSGKLLQNINITNSYLDIPLMAVGRFGDFEISGGAFLGLKIQSLGEGGMTYESNQTNPQKLEYNLAYNYNRDDPGESPDPDGDQLLISLNNSGQKIELPKTLGAYYDYAEDKGRLFNTMDYGLVGGLSYYISRSLYIGARVQYGLADVTNNKADLAKFKAGENNAPVFRNDKDRNFAIQASVGFNF